MNFTQRALLYISRKKGKTISLFLLVSVIAVFLISCFGILKAAGRLSRDIRTSLGAAFYIRASTEVSMKENGEAEIKENKIHITQKEIDEIIQAGEIKYCNPINYGFAKSDAIQFIPGDKHTKESNLGKVTALRFSALAPDFADETAILTEGRHITEADKGKILISEELANANQLSVGDTLTLTHAKFGEMDGRYIDEIPVKTAFLQVEISGIYQLCGKDSAGKPTASIAENEIYASLDILDGLHESEVGIYTGEVDFYITDPAKLDGVIRNVQLLQSIDWATHFIRTNDFQYSKVADQLSSLGGFAKMLLVLVSVTSTAFLTLLLTLRMHGRMQEAGILLAAGISKGQIMAGFLLEVLSVTVIALILSYLISFGVTGVLGHSLFRGLQPNLLNEATLGVGMMGTETKSHVSIGKYLKLDAGEILLLYLCQIAVIATSTFVSSIWLMRLKPKEILSKMS